jgi:hypothetical protein
MAQVNEVIEPSLTTVGKEEKEIEKEGEGDGEAESDS